MKFLLLLALLWAPVWAQTQVQTQPDCVASFAFSATGNSAVYVNTKGCMTWTLFYESTGFGSVSLTFQSASGITTPGSFGTYGGTVETGVNPNTSTTGATTIFSNGAVNTPFLRVAATLSGSGTLQGTFYGWRTGSSGSGGGGGGSGCAGTVMTPCVTGAENSSAAAVTDITCDQSAAVSISGSGETQIVAASSGKSVRICSLDFANSAVSNFTIEEGTGTNCGTSTTALTGTYQNVLTYSKDYGSRSPLVGGSGDAICLNFASSVTAGGSVVYAQF